MSEKVTIKVERKKLHLPTIALRGLVVFPNNLVHFEVGREKSIAAVEWAMANNSNVFLVAQKSMDTTEPQQADLFSYGVVAEVKQVLRVSGDLVKVLVEGKYRAKLSVLDASGDFLLSEVRPAPVRTGKADDAVETEALLRALKAGFDEYLGMNPRLGKDVVFAIVSSDDPAFLSEYMPANLLFRYEDKQAVMDEGTLNGRLKKLIEMLRRECQVMKIEKEIAEKVNESMDKNQRDYYLHEQLHIISDELGEGDDTHAEADEYRRRITGLHLAEDSEKKLLKEVDRLAKMQGSNQEATVIRTYLDTCLDLPWNTFTVDDLDISRAQQILDRDHYGLKKVKDRILETLAVRKLAPDVKAQIICLVGPPGVGKTSIARSIAESLGRKYVRISLGGVRDEAEIRGHRRTYIGAMPGKIITAMISAKSANPLMLLDEIDKLAGDFRGDPAAALLEALDPEQNSTFNDHFIDIPFDLSHVLFITTANDLGSIPGPLRDRMDVIELPSYTRVEKYNIARKHLLPKQLKACGLTGKVTLSQSALYGIIDGYTREAGVRNLERTITSVLRKCARKIAAGETESVSVTGTMLEQLLGPRFVKPDFLNRTNAVGIANGLAWTSVGGETLPIEVQVMDNGSGKITVTGSLGDVMKESAQLAVTWVRVHAAEYGIDPEKLKKCDLHIHAPEGAVPKDGPSAGVTLTTALVSCLSGIPVRGDVAMTGEITLHGNVLPIGGLREKSMAAYREGMKTVLIPKDNEPDLYEVDDEVKKNLTFLPMQSLTQVLNAALLKPQNAKKAKAPSRTHAKKKAADAAIVPPTAEKPQPGAVC
ncbi:endopeptidase La [Faecalibacterium sp. AM43-5AT]|uniref:endopeptidase La n=1 Tax=Faecalibacterium sp. AM43-5AT TaxID=2302957 RepID=UPI000E75D716|nr:endopeptidase La [Faecalibacterium sp. AM43-5AT]RJV98656.1 endopeptidase La [Faecalibacterium sp. AM43-5AT]